MSMSTNVALARELLGTHSTLGAAASIVGFSVDEMELVAESVVRLNQSAATLDAGAAAFADASSSTRDELVGVFSNDASALRRFAGQLDDHATPFDFSQRLVDVQDHLLDGVRALIANTDDPRLVRAQGLLDASDEVGRAVDDIERAYYASAGERPGVLALAATRLEGVADEYDRSAKLIDAMDPREFSGASSLARAAAHYRQTATDMLEHGQVPNEPWMMHASAQRGALNGVSELLNLSS